MPAFAVGTAAAVDLGVALVVDAEVALADGVKVMTIVTTEALAGTGTTLVTLLSIVELVAIAVATSAVSAEADAASGATLDSAWRFAIELAARRREGAHKAVAANAATATGSFMIAVYAVLQSKI